MSTVRVRHSYPKHMYQMRWTCLQAFPGNKRYAPMRIKFDNTNSLFKRLGACGSNLRRKTKKLELILSASAGECLALYCTASYDMHKVRRAIKTSVAFCNIETRRLGARVRTLQMVGSPRRFVSRE
jgi:hypothetical protein